MKEPEKPKLSKDERLELFIERLRQAELAGSFEEGYQLVCETLTLVEDEHSGVPSNPDMWRDDGRLYPPQEDMARAVEKAPGVTEYRSKKHKIFIAKNGAILIWDIFNRRMVLSKKGTDGKEVPKAALG
jgi:hypothetical protein